MANNLKTEANFPKIPTSFFVTEQFWWSWHISSHPEPILSIRRIRKLRRAPETPGGPLALNDDFSLVTILNLASGYENMNDNLL